MTLLLVLVVLIPLVVLGRFQVKRVNKKFVEKADLLEGKIISGYNMDFARYEFEQLERIAMTKNNRERLSQLKRLFVTKYGHFIR